MFASRLLQAVRAFALLEDPGLEARIAREATVMRAHHRRPAGARSVQRARRPGAVRSTAQPCRSPVLR